MQFTLLQIQQLMNEGITRIHHGYLQEAEISFRHVLQADPTNSDALHLLGIVRNMLGDPHEAIRLIRAAIQNRPAFPEALSNLGSVLGIVGDHRAGVESCQTAIRYRPDYADAWYNLGNALRGLSRFDDAVAAYQKTLEIQPDYPPAIENLGITLAGRRRYAEAIDLFIKAIQIRPDHAPNHANLGHVYRLIGEYEASKTAYFKALSLQPDMLTVINNFASDLAQQGQLDQAMEMFRHASNLPPTPGQLEVHQSMIFMMHAHPDFTQSQITEEAQRWCMKFAPERLAEGRTHANNRDPERRLRIGYVSPDFYNHPVGRFLLPIYRHRDREKYEVFSYSLARNEDRVSESLRNYSDVWRDISLINDAHAADLISSDQIDILIDLSMHSSSNRLAIFAYKPAPIQVTYLAYASGTGMQQIDYRLSDRYLDPESDENPYVEQTIRLPDCYWCYEPETDEPTKKVVPAIKNGFITFGCLNSCHKVNARVIEVWARIMQAVPNSKLILHTKSESHRNWVRESFAASAIDSSRLELVGGVPRREYDDLYRRIDIALDPFPFGGGTTTFDALWMGVPVITLWGRTAVGRAGTSILSNLGLTELVAHDQPQYIDIAVHLAKDLDQLKHYRESLRPTMLKSAVMDQAKHCRSIEDVYRKFWKKWCDRLS